MEAGPEPDWSSQDQVRGLMPTHNCPLRVRGTFSIIFPPEPLGITAARLSYKLNPHDAKASDKHYET